jgi:hypothetical protein
MTRLRVRRSKVVHQLLAMLHSLHEHLHFLSVRQAEGHKESCGRWREVGSHGRRNGSGQPFVGRIAADCGDSANSNGNGLRA